MQVIQILIVEDDADIRELIAMVVQDHRFRPIKAQDGATALNLFRTHQPDLVLLDVVMPDMDGFMVCRRIRQESNVPIIYLSGRRESRDIVQGLELGGDDYIVKPFQPEVLLARIRANLRRFRKDGQDPLLVYGDLVINRGTYEVRCRDRVIPFLAKEVKLFIYLAERPRRIFHVEQLYEAVWDSSEGDARTVMVHISNIRQKLMRYAPDTVRIETVKGIGYRFVP